jgi:hypothetical protein
VFTASAQYLLRVLCSSSIVQAISQGSTPWKKKGCAITNCEIIEANAKCVENNFFASSKSFVVQQKEKFVPQVDTRSDMVIGHSTSSSGTTYSSVMAA